MIDPPLVRIPAPAAVTEPTRAGFPLIATLAPIGIAVVLFAATGSAFMLLMAVFGPVVAVASVLDGVRGRRRTRRGERARYARELVATRERIAVAKTQERARLRDFGSTDAQWSAGPDFAAVVAVGLGEAPSGILLDGEAGDDLDADRRDAGRLSEAPLVRSAAHGVAVEGPLVLAAAAARMIALRLLARHSPATTALETPPDETWTSALPHAVVAGTAGRYLLVVGETRIAICWDAPVPPGAVRVDAFAADAVTRRDAAARAADLARAARAAGLRAPGADLPELVRWRDLGSADPAGGLSAPIGLDAGGVVSVDLVSDGPHALVAGTTGSGKSELLISWVLSLASRHAPDEVAFVLVDFKGGASFAPLAGLPHVLGTVSDLDPRLAHRAVESLRAEVLRRERLLASAQVRSVDDLDPGRLARLVVVVDEFAALIADQPETHAVFADIAARGRSLGIHLILCTQRPAGVVRDAVLANVAIRIALRVADRSDSISVVGDESACRLPATQRGRAVVLDASGRRRILQLAMADADDIAGVRMRTPAEGCVDAAPRPWCDPLPTSIAHESLPTSDVGPGIAFGLLDLPAQQRQPVAMLEPRHGHVLVLGAPGSGRSTALESFAAGAARAGRSARWLPEDPVGLWAALDDPALLEPAGLVLIDDLDRVLAACDADRAADLADLLIRALRDAPRHDVVFALSATRLAGGVHTVAAHTGSRLVLRMPSREEHLIAGADSTWFDPRALPGAGWWDGAVVQVARPVPTPRSVLEPPAPIVIRPGEREIAVVATRPREIIARWGSADIRWVGSEADGLVSSTPPVIWLGDPDAWQADWSALSRARRELPLVFHACAPADVRAVSRLRQTPPPHRSDEVLLALDGEFRRAVLGERGREADQSSASASEVAVIP